MEGRETIGTFRLKQVKQILVAYPQPQNTETSSVLVSKVHSCIKEVPRYSLCSAGWLSRMAYYPSLHMIPTKPSRHIWPLLLVLVWTVALASLACTWYTFKLHWRKGADFRQAQEFLIYFTKCFCCKSHILLYMAINICCFGPHKKSLRR